MLAGLVKSVFVRNILVVMSGTAVAQVIGFALKPIISRLYSPVEFGTFGAFNAVLTVVAAGVTLDYSQAIMLPKQKRHAAQLLWLSCSATVSVAVLCLTTFLIFPGWLSSLVHNTGGWVLGLLTLGSLVVGVNKTFQAWSVRSKAFKHTSASQVIRSLSSNGMTVAFGFFGGGSIALIVAMILADILATLNLTRVFFSDSVACRVKPDWVEFKRLTIEYRDFPMYSASQNVVNALSQGLAVLLLTRFYGLATAGAYAFSVRMLCVPMRFVTTALRQVLFQKASETQHQGGSLTSLYSQTTASLLALAIPASLPFLLWGPEIFAWVFGPQWGTAGEFARSLIIWLTFGFCNLPAVLFGKIIRIQRFVFLYDLALLAARAVTLVVGGMHLTASQTVMLFALVGAVMNAFLILLVGHLVRRKESRTGGLDQLAAGPGRGVMSTHGELSE